MARPSSIPQGPGELTIPGIGLSRARKTLLVLADIFGVKGQADASGSSRRRSRGPALSYPIGSGLLPIAANRRRTPMPVSRLGAVEEYPVAFVRGAGLQPSEPAHLRQTDHLPQHPAERIRARNRDKLDGPLIGDRQHERKLPACRGKVTRCLFGLRPMLRRNSEENLSGPSAIPAQPGDRQRRRVLPGATSRARASTPLTGAACRSRRCRHERCRFARSAADRGCSRNRKAAPAQPVRRIPPKVSSTPAYAFCWLTQLDTSIYV